MRIYATKREEVLINPLDVINQLIDNEYNSKTDYTHIENGLCFIVRDRAEKVEITRDKYEYIESLKSVRNYLNAYNK